MEVSLQHKSKDIIHGEACVPYNWDLGCWVGISTRTHKVKRVGKELLPVFDTLHMDRPAAERYAVKLDAEIKRLKKRTLPIVVFNHGVIGRGSDGGGGGTGQVKTAPVIIRGGAGGN